MTALQGQATAPQFVVSHMHKLNLLSYFIFSDGLYMSRGNKTTSRTWLPSVLFTVQEAMNI
jgi:hypothetical protein